MKIAETTIKPATVESIQTTHRRHLKPESQTRQMGKREGFTEQSESNRIQEEKTRLNVLSLEMRASDRSIEDTETQLSRLYEEMKGVVKQYPPFPPGSEERVARLKGITALRKEIDQLTIPPVEQRLAASANEEHGSRIKKREALTSEIPVLGPSAADEEVYRAMDAVRDSADAVRRRRQGFESEAHAFLRHEARKGLWQRFFEGMPGVDSDSVAASVSARVASSLSDLQDQEGVRSLTWDSSPLTDFMG